jgi:RimJ/RimL family protein N-acetyltransferase
MSKLALVYEFDPVWSFARTKLPGLRWCDGMVGIGLTRDDAVVAGVLYEGYNPHNIWAHIAAEPGGQWLTKTFLRAMFAYPFKVCGVQWLRGYVDASNQAARRFDEHLGFREEARLEGAAQDGGDVIVYAMRRSECRFLER